MLTLCLHHYRIGPTCRISFFSLLCCSLRTISSGGIGSPLEYFTVLFLQTKTIHIAVWAYGFWSKIFVLQGLRLHHKVNFIFVLFYDNLNIFSYLQVCGCALCAGRPGPFLVLSCFRHLARRFWNHTW